MYLLRNAAPSPSAGRPRAPLLRGECGLQVPGRQPGRGVDRGRGGAGGGDTGLQPGTLDILAVDKYTLLLHRERLLFP